MKKIVLLVFSIVLFFSSPVVAGDGSHENGNHNDNEQQQGQGQRQGINQDFSSHGNISGNFPFVPNLPGMYPPGYFPGYDRQINATSSKDIIRAIPVVTRTGFEKFKARLIEARGEEFFASLSQSILLRPTITNPKNPVQAAYFIEDLSRFDVSKLEPVGIIAADTKLAKEGEFAFLAYRQELQMFCAVDVLRDGANILVPLDAFRAWITPSGVTKGGGISAGFLKAISSLFGISAAAEIQSTEQKTVMRGDTAVTYLLFHVDDLDGFFSPKKPEPTKVEPPKPEPKPVCDPQQYIDRDEKLRIEISLCHTPCLNNETKRKQKGDNYIDWYRCTGGTDKELLKKAVKEYEIGERDFLNGYEDLKKKTLTKNLPEAQTILYKIYWNWAAAIRELHGKEREAQFAREKGLNKKGNCKMPSSLDEILR